MDRLRAILVKEYPGLENVLDAPEDADITSLYDNKLRSVKAIENSAREELAHIVSNGILSILKPAKGEKFPKEMSSITISSN